MMIRFDPAEALRGTIRDPWTRETWEAYMREPWFRENLSPADRRRYAEEAYAKARALRTDDYLATWEDVRSGYRRMMQKYRLPESRRNASARRMLARFMVGRVNAFQEAAAAEGNWGEPILPGPGDLPNGDLAEIFAMLPPQPETAKWLEDIGVCYEYDNLHMVCWFACQLTPGSGFYSRSRPNHSAKKTYERLRNPLSLLWIAAALGEDPETVKAAAREAEGYLTWTAKCGVIRRAVPWKRIYALALAMKRLEESGAVDWDVPLRKAPGKRRSPENETLRLPG